MKKIYFAALLVYLSYASFGQITITKNDMPTALDTARYSTSNTRLNFDTTGAGVIWDYSALVANGQGVDSFESPLLINLAYGLYFGLTTNYGVSAPNINYLLGSLTNVYNFYKTSSADLQINGIGAELSGIPLPFNYTTPDKVYQFPLTYGRIDTSAYDVTISVPATVTIHEVGTRINTVDGWGTLITPYDTFQCIRLKSVTNEVDSVTITLLGFTIGIPRTTTTYKWLANGVIIPALEVTGNSVFGTFVPTSEKFRDGVRFIPPQFNLRINFTASLTTCTTADTVTITPRVRPGNITGTTYLYTISPSTFNFASGTDSTTTIPKVNFTAPGLYTVSMYVTAPAGGSVPATADTTKVNYILVGLPNGIEQISAANVIQVYPNPANDHIACQLDGDENKQATIELLDMTGSILYTAMTRQKGTINIPTTNIPTGEYLIRATSNGGTSYVQKVTVMH